MPARLPAAPPPCLPLIVHSLLPAAASPAAHTAGALPPSHATPLQLDPTDCRRLAFHLGCGWSGVLDLHAGAITHLHAPAHAPYEEPAGPAAGAAGDGAAFTSVAQMLLWASTAAPGELGQGGGVVGGTWVGTWTKNQLPWGGA